MNDQLDPTLAMSRQFRVFIQHLGSSPLNAYEYVGCQSLGGFQEDLGTGEPVYCPSSTVPGGFDIVETTLPPPSMPTTDFTQHMSRYLNDIFWDLRKRRCEFNMIIKGSNCAQPDDLDDFESKIIARRTRLTTFNTGEFNNLAEDAAIDLTGTLQMISFDRFLPITFGEVADSDVFAEVLDVMYADKVQCGNCGEQSNGCQKAYVLTLAEPASPSLSSQIVYTLDEGGSWGQDDIDSLAGASGIRMAQVGTRVVVISQTDLAHHHKQQSLIDAGSSGGWSRVAGGYVASKGPRAIWSKSPSRTYVAGAGGYIYLMSNPAAAVSVLSDGSATTQNLNDIRGTGRTVVAVGASNAVIVSQNDGTTWALVTGPAIGIALTTVEVINQSIWFIGCANGKSYFTVNGGNTWVENTPDADITDVNMIRFVDEVVGYMSVEISGGVRIYRTADNGRTWHFDAPYVDDVPNAARYNAIAPCPNNYNTLLAGGVAAVGTDGIIALGAA